MPVIFVTAHADRETLNRARADDFVDLVRAPANRPLFVYDRDGSLSGALWYLYFRAVETMPLENARQRARTLGLREERGGEYQAMWLAVQRLLGENSR